MYPQDEEFHQRHIAEYVKQNIRALAGMPPSLYNRAARFFYYVVPSSIFNWSMRCAPLHWTALCLPCPCFHIAAWSHVGLIPSHLQGRL